MAGKIVAEDVLEVIASFEDLLPNDVLLYSLRRPAEIVSPSQAPELIQPFRLDRKTSPLRKETEKQLRRAVGGTIVRFASDIKLTTAETGELSKKQEYTYDVHIAVQGPDMINHAEWTAFGIIAKLLRRTVDELNGPEDYSGLRDSSFEINESVEDDLFGGDRCLSDLLTFSTQERKWPLAAFTLRGMEENELESCEYRFHRLIQMLITPAPGNDLCLGVKRNLEKVLRCEVAEYRDKMEWRAEYDVVMSLTAWVASCTLSEPGGKSSFCSALHPAIDIRELRQKPPDWWISFVEKHFTKCVLMTEVVRNSNSGSYLAEGGLSRRSSRWSLSTGGSERGDFSDHSEQLRPAWERDKDVLDYLESIGGCTTFR